MPNANRRRRAVRPVPRTGPPAPTWLDIKKADIQRILVWVGRMTGVAARAAGRCLRRFLWAVGVFLRHVTHQAARLGGWAAKKLRPEVAVSTSPSHGVVDAAEANNTGVVHAVEVNNTVPGVVDAVGLVDAAAEFNDASSGGNGRVPEGIAGTVVGAASANNPGPGVVAAVGLVDPARSLDDAGRSGNGRVPERIARTDAPASISAPGPASQASHSAPRLEANPANLHRPTGANTTPSASTAEAHGFAHSRGLHRENPFSDGYNLNSLFEEDQCSVVDENALIYARFCSKRATFLLIKREMCHICYFDLGEVASFKKNELLKHYSSIHKTGGFLCEKEGCFIRTSSKGDIGRHHYFCHEKSRDWWVQCLKLHREM